MQLPFVSRKKYDELVYKLECLLCHATGGRYSKATYNIEDMCRMVNDYIDRCILDTNESGVVRKIFKEIERVLEDNEVYYYQSDKMREDFRKLKKKYESEGEG